MKESSYGNPSGPKASPLAGVGGDDSEFNLGVVDSIETSEEVRQTMLDKGKTLNFLLGLLNYRVPLGVLLWLIVLVLVTEHAHQSTLWSSIAGFLKLLGFTQ
jgi:hypothetical protein